MRPLAAKKTALATAMAGAAILIGAMVLSALGGIGLHLYDNKYTAGGPQAQKGLLTIDDNTLSGADLIFLIDGWEFYPDELVSTEDFENGKKALRHTYVGQYKNFSQKQKDRSIYGVATYRMVIENRGKPRTLTIEFPELYSASEIFIGGELRKAFGSMDLNDYSAHGQYTTISFYAEGQTEILVRTTSYTDYLGGMYYPPVLGPSDAITHLSVCRALFYGFFCFTALAFALAKLSEWYVSRKKNVLGIYFCGMCLFIALQSSYSFLRWLGVPLEWPVYTLEDTAAFLSIFCAVSINSCLCGTHHKGWYRRFIRPLEVTMCCVSMVMPTVLLVLLPGAFENYYAITVWYKVVIGAFLMGLAFYGYMKRRPGAALLLAADGTFFIISLMYALRTSPYDSIYTGLPVEYSRFLFMLLLAAALLYCQRAERKPPETAPVCSALQGESGK